MTLNDIIKSLSSRARRTSADWEKVKGDAAAALADAEAQLADAEARRTQALLGSETELQKADQAATATRLVRDRARAALDEAERRLDVALDDEAAAEEARYRAELKATRDELLTVGAAIDQQVAALTAQLKRRNDLLKQLTDLAPEGVNVPDTEALGAVLVPLKALLHVGWMTASGLHWVLSGSDDAGNLQAVDNRATALLVDEATPVEKLAPRRFGGRTKSPSHTAAE